MGRAEANGVRRAGIAKYFLYLWTFQTSAYKKTIYDPCPRGWRVPAGNGIWADALGSADGFTMTYDTDLEGMDFSGKFGSDDCIWYPAAGCRISVDGSLSDIPWSGNCWTVT